MNESFIQALLRVVSDEQSHRLAIDLDNGQTWLEIDRCATELDWVIIPVPAFFSIEQRTHMLELSGIDVVCCDQQMLPWWQAQGFQIVHCDNGQKARVFCLYRTAEHAPVIPEGTHKITFTSGTTGQPKGVCLSQAHLHTVGQSLAQAIDHLGLSRHISLLPYSVLLENMAVSYANQLAGLEVIALPLAEVGMTGSGQLNMTTMLDAICQHRADSMIMMPQMLKQLVMILDQHPRDLSFINFIAVGGAVCSAQLIEQAQSVGLPVFQGYGISECGSVICLDHQASAPGSVGRPLPHCQLEVAADGEILVQGPQHLGYLEAQQDTVTDPQVPFATGDIGHFDESGHLYISGRKKHLIINSFGRNILPDWIEGELLAIGGILQAIIYGEAEPFLTALCVTQMKQHELHQAISVLNQQLPDYAQLKAAVIVPPFTPSNGLLTASGKPVRSQIFNQHQPLLESIYATNTCPAKAHAI
ncbi:AMP-binding protein [Marinicella sediminis]|nr:AMP-binding protein [Marinicella sediminis]